VPGIAQVGSSQDGTARSHLKTSDASAVDHYEPVAVPAAQYAAIFREGLGDALHDLFWRAFIVVVGHIQVLAAHKADAQHDLCHGHAP
jgi:hypothetical protein